MSTRAAGVSLSFWGAVGTVTGSKYLLETGRSRVLIDCGLFQGLKELRDRNWADPPFDPRRLDAVVLTHAHLDHIGYLPRLVANGFKGRIYCTRATASVGAIILEDSARLLEEEAEWRNKKGLTRHDPALPLYTDRDVQRTLELLHPVRPQDEPVEVAPGIRAQFAKVGHLLGARMVRLEVEGGKADGTSLRILFSGDVGRRYQPILPDPEPPLECDCLLVESTYGNRRHPEGDPANELAALVLEAHARNAPVLIPAFAVGRTQDLLYHLRALEDAARIPALPVRVDSPMAARATQVYRQACEEHDEEYARLEQLRRNPLETHRLGFASSRDESRKLNDETGARVIIAASGMMTGGRVIHHARRIVPDPKAILCFSGFQAEGTTGRRILDGEPEVKLYREWFPVRCEVRRIEGFSAHADYAELLEWLAPLAEKPPKDIFIVHGEPDAAFGMQAHLHQRFGWEAVVPAYGHRAELG